MKRYGLFLVIVSAALSARTLGGQSWGIMNMGSHPMMGDSFGPMANHLKFLTQYEKAEFDAIRSELGAKTLGEIGGTDLGAWTDRLSVARQKDAWLLGSMTASMRFPGLGQLKNGDSAGGGLFLAAHFLTIAGGLTAWYFLLPADLRFDKLDYFNSSFTAIKTDWENHSFIDYLPSIGASVGGVVVDMVWRIWSARSALAEAKSGIDSGKITFQPIDLPGGLGFRFRY